MHNDKESSYSLTLLDADLSLQVLQFSGQERLNQPYRFEIEVTGQASALDLECLLHQPAYLRLEGESIIHGIVQSATREHRHQQPHSYNLVLVPHLQHLDGMRNRRVFHQLDVPAILLRLLQENALPASSYRFELPAARYPLRPFCIQFDESDLAFLQRLCEEEGIHYHFEHQRDGHVLVFADDSLSFPQEPLLIAFCADAPHPAKIPVISELFQRHTAAPVMAHRAADYLDRAQLSRRVLERLRCVHRQIHGQSEHSEMRSGRIVQISEHPMANFNDQWLLTEVQHHREPPALFAENSTVDARAYKNSFTAIPWSTEFRPPLTRRRPAIPGYQPARVLGPIGQPACVDEQGRIAVRLWPVGACDGDESCGVWLPVVLAAQMDEIDPARLPVGGTEVLVSFLDSDPDRPVLCAMASAPPPTVRRAGGDDRLLLDWLINR
ncbi:type VI secretion system Vgr family protein [Pseudomonas sp. TMB3-21]